MKRKVNFIFITVLVSFMFFVLILGQFGIIGNVVKQKESAKGIFYPTSWE
jgi:hypothetical protein